MRAVILDHLDEVYEEGMQYGMIGYYVPYKVFPAGYHCDPKQPLPFAGLAAHKSTLSLYLMSVYGSPEEAEWFRTAWAKTGKKLNMGKSCIRFKKLDDLALDVIGRAIQRIPAPTYIAQVVAVTGARNGKTSRGKTSRGRTSKPIAARSLTVASVSRVA